MAIPITNVPAVVSFMISPFCITTTIIGFPSSQILREIRIFSSALLRRFHPPGDGAAAFACASAWRFGHKTIYFYASPFGKDLCLCLQ